MTLTEQNETLEYMRFIIQDICEKIGPRPPCSNEEANCANYIKTELKKYTNETKIDTFTCQPDAYRWQFRIPMILFIISVICYWFYFINPLISFLIIPFLLISFSIIIIQTNIMRNIAFIDPFYKNEESTNVMGRLLPKSETKKIIVIGAHHDSNWEFPILRKSPILFGALIILPVIFNHVFFAVLLIKLILHYLSFYYFIIPQVDMIFMSIFSVLIPIFIFTSINVVSNTPVLGADDNLTGIAIMLAIAKQINQKMNLNNTEIWLVSHGCEEIGDRGSKVFSKKHQEELHDAFIINLDMIGGKGNILKIDIAEQGGLIKLSKELGNYIASVAKELNIKHKVGMVPAFSDSMAYAMNKLTTCSIIGLPEKGYSNHYHTRNDTMNIIDYNNLVNCYEILIEFIKKIDKKSNLTRNTS